MRKLMLLLVLTGLTAGVAVPAVAAPDPTKPTGERCVKRAESSKLDAADKATVAKACTDRAAAVRAARVTFRAAREAHKTAVTGARTTYRDAVKAAAALPKAERRAARRAARKARNASVSGAKRTLRVARKAHRDAVKAANVAFREAVREAKA